MTAVTVGTCKLKITLDTYESARLFGNVEKLSCYDPEIRSVLRRLLGHAVEKTNFKLDCKRLYVEMYPSAHGGFVIYFTKRHCGKRYKRNRAPSSMFLLRFTDTNRAISASKIIPTKDIVKSSLHKYDRFYYLIVSCSPSTFSPATITEFADSVLCSEKACAIICEYGKSVIDERAIEKLSNL